MNKTVFKKEICNYCKFYNKECPYFKELVIMQENSIKIIKCNFYEKNLDI